MVVVTKQNELLLSLVEEHFLRTAREHSVSLKQRRSKLIDAEDALNLYIDLIYHIENM